MKANEVLDIVNSIDISEQKHDDLVLQPAQYKEVLAQIEKIQKEYLGLYTTLVGYSHSETDTRKKNALHRMVKRVSGEQLDLDKLHRFFNR